MAATLADPIARAAADLGQLLTQAEADIVQGFTDRYRSIFDHGPETNNSVNNRTTDTDALARALRPNTRRLFNDAAMSQASSPRAATDLRALCRLWDVEYVTVAAEFGARRNKKFWQHLRHVSRLLPSWPAALAALAAARATRKKMARVPRMRRWVDTDLELCIKTEQEQEHQQQEQGAGRDEAGEAVNGDGVVSSQQPQHPRPNMANIAVARAAGAGGLSPSPFNSIPTPSRARAMTRTTNTEPQPKSKAESKSAAAASRSFDHDDTASSPAVEIGRREHTPPPATEHHDHPFSSPRVKPDTNDDHDSHSHSHSQTAGPDQDFDIGAGMWFTDDTRDRTVTPPLGSTPSTPRHKKRSMQEHREGDEDGQEQGQGQAPINTGDTRTRSRKRPRTAAAEEEEQDEEQEEEEARIRGTGDGSGHPYKCLAPDTWLNDMPIHDILQDLAIMSDDAFIAVDPLITTGPGSRAPRRLQEQLSEHPAAALLIPLHLKRDRHWLLVVARRQPSRLDIYDSLYDARSSSAPSSCVPAVHDQKVKAIRDALAGLWARLSRLHEHGQDQDDDVNPWRLERWTVTLEPCAPQPNTYDCGTSVIISACLAVASAAAPAQAQADHGVSKSALSSLPSKQPDWILWRRLAA